MSRSGLTPAGAGQAKLIAIEGYRSPISRPSPAAVEARCTPLLLHSGLDSSVVEVKALLCCLDASTGRSVVG